MPYDHRTVNPFYSTSLETKYAALADIAGMSIVDVLDDISDGCGGCEARRITGTDGARYWLSVFTENGQHVTYIALAIDPNAPTIVTTSDLVSVPWTGTDSQDSRAAYTEALAAIEAFRADGLI